MRLDFVKQVSHLGPLDFSGRYSPSGIIMSLSLPMSLGFKASFVVSLFMSYNFAFALCWIYRLLFFQGLLSVKRDRFCKLFL